MNLRKRFIAAATILFSGLISSFAQAADLEEYKMKVDHIYYFGYDGLDLAKIEKSMMVKDGDVIDERHLYDQRDSMFKNVKELTGKSVTDAALVNVGHDRHYLFVGLPGKSNTDEVHYLPVGKEKIQVPLEIAKTYDEYIEELPLYLLKKEESRKKHMQDLEMKMKEQSKPKRAELRKSLLESKDANDRLVAGYALGLVAEEQADFDAVTRAANDVNSTVRNNSTRELATLIDEKPELIAKISEQALNVYADMLNSRTWTDRNKATFIFEQLSKTRNPRVLDLMRKKSLVSLKEMLLWPTGYVDSAMTLIGRIGGIPEDKLKKLIDSNDVSAIVNSVK